MGVASWMTNLLGFFDHVTKRSLPSYCFLETSDGGNGLVAKDGSVVTVVRVDGTRQMMGDDELTRLSDYGNTKLSPYLSRPGHAIQVWFSRDPDLSPQLVRTLMAAPRSVARQLDLDLDDLFSERENYLPGFIVHEGFYIALWTRLAVLNKQEMAKLKASQKPPLFWPAAADCQQPFVASRQITVGHDAFVDAFVQDMAIFGIRSKPLEAHDALRAIRQSVYPDMYGSSWRPRLPGDGARDRGGKPRAYWTRRPEISQHDMSHLLWPRIDDQLFSRGGEMINQHLVRLGRYVFGAVDMSVGPQDLLPFTDLLNRMRADEFPWRVSFMIEGDGLPKMMVKSFLASVATVTNSDNRTVRDAIKALSLYKQNGGVVPRVRISFATWAPSDRTDLAEERVSRLQKAVEGWGYCGASCNAGDPLSGVMSSALGLDVASTAAPGCVPLPDIISILPWMRDASPFENGSVLFRTPDGRPWPYQPGSGEQDNTVDIVYAPPGRGKSVWLNTTNLAFCLSPLATQGMGGARLPMVAIIDIGISSSGMISLLKEALPANRRHEADYRRLRMIREHAINPFDTQLGCRKPLPHEKAFLVNFVTLLGTDPSETKSPRGLSDLADRAVDEVYQRLSDRTRGGQPRLYVEGEDPALDGAAKKYCVTVTEETTWWDLTDMLFARGARREAALAQRHAVPLVEDLIQIVNTPQIADIFGEATIEGGERLVKAFQRVLNSCLRAYPILSSPTRFDIGGARVISLDLDEAAPSAGGGPADKQTAMVYMLARFILARDFYLIEDNLAEMLPEYRNYHRARITRIRETPKRLVFDEFHRTSASPMVRAQVVRDMREGRKWGVQIALASQLLSDFNKDMLGLSTGFWIMGVNNEEDLTEAKQKFGLSATATDAIPRYLNGPGRGGAPFLVVLQMKDGRHEHLLFNTLGPMELWAFSTTWEDVALRKRLYAKLGPSEARQRLAKRFPTGTAKNEIQRRIVEMVERGAAHGDDAQEGVIQELANELMGPQAAKA